MELRQTEDGSHTIFNLSLGESYHSLNGAVNESMHVFIRAGLRERLKETKELRILEIGFGTGLNMLLTFKETRNAGCSVDYIALEPYPLDPGIVGKLNHPEHIEQGNLVNVFRLMHTCEWGSRTALSGDLHLTKVNSRLQDYSPDEPGFDVIYFDAFSPEVQPELWTLDIFRKLARISSPGCILVTYSAKGQVRRNMAEAGFTVERLPGPAGKREMLRGRYAGSKM